MVQKSHLTSQDRRKSVLFFVVFEHKLKSKYITLDDEDI